MSERLISAVTCLGCGCACDDIEVQVRDERIVETRNACALGAAWFGDGRVPLGARAAGGDVTAAAALDAAAALLAGASRPLVYIAPDLSCEAQREAVALADALGALLDSVTTVTADGILAAQARGRAGATLGEVRNRADVLLFWGIDPAARYPRFWSRYAPEPSGLHVAEGRRSRSVIAVDVGDARGPADADLRITIAAHDDIPVLTALTAAIARYKPDPTTETLGPRREGAADDITLTPEGPAYERAARQLVTSLVHGRYVVIVADAEPNGERDPFRAEALLLLGEALNGPTRAALFTLRAGGNRTGADAVMTAQTGYPMTVDFARGYPRYVPTDAAVPRLARNEIDAMIIVGSAAGAVDPVRRAMLHVPTVVIGPHATTNIVGDRAIAIDTGVAGIHDAGTALRMDDVPLPLRPAIGGAPAAVDIIRELCARVAAR